MAIRCGTKYHLFATASETALDQFVYIFDDMWFQQDGATYHLQRTPQWAFSAQEVRWTQR